LKKKGALSRDAIAATVMSNMGLELALQGEGIKLLRTSVGDRYVAERLRRERLNFGGEKSGHLIFLDHATTGDGTLAALQTLAVMATAGRPLRDLASLVHLMPQVLISVPSARPAEAAAHPSVAAAVKSVELRLGPMGRALLRPSGTEPVVRVMIEGEDEDQINALAQECAQAVAGALG
jgi:phosphoglucosamine mutase